jgi:hypothetical protein
MLDHLDFREHHHLADNRSVSINFRHPEDVIPEDKVLFTAHQSFTVRSNKHESLTRDETVVIFKTIRRCGAQWSNNGLCLDCDARTRQPQGGRSF